MEIRHMLSAVRVELLEPKAQKPGYRRLLHLAVGVIQSRMNRVANTGRAWTIGETTLSVAEGTEDYTLSAPNVGKVLDVATVYDPANESWSEHQIPYHDLNDMAVDNWGAYDGGTRIAFYRKDGQLRARVRPTPSVSTDYRVSYSVGTWAQDAGLSDSPLLEEFHHLFTVETALHALPGAEWSDDAKADEAKRGRLERSFLRRRDEGSQEFDLYVAALNIPRNTQRYEAFPIE